MNEKRKIAPYNGTNITFNRESSGVMVNATEMAKPFRKRVNDWMNLPSTKQFLQALERVRFANENSITRKSCNFDYQLVTTNVGAPENGGGSWFHEDVALEFARWLSPEFGIWCNDRIKELMTQGVATVSDDDAVIAQAMQVLQRRLDTSKQRVQILEGQNEHLTREVKQLAPKAAYTDEVLQSTSTYTMTQVAKELGISAVALEKKLHDAGIMFRQSGQWMLYAKYQGNSLTKPRTHHFTHNDGSTGTNTITVWTERGRAWVHQLWKGGKI